MKKILFFDVETTGLDPKLNDIIQLSGCIDIDGKTVDEFDIKMQPFSYNCISQEALEVHGITIEKIKTFQSPVDGYREFIEVVSTYVDRFDKDDKFHPAGYNVGFDLEFLNQFFIKNRDKFFGSWQNWKALDPLPVLRIMDYLDLVSLPNLKLETVCNHLGIQIKAHDAMSDIKATRNLVYRCCAGLDGAKDSFAKLLGNVKEGSNVA